MMSIKIVKQRADLPDSASESLGTWMRNPALLAEAGAVVDRQSARSRGDRSRDQAVSHFVKGWALERVVAEWLTDLGCTVEPAPKNEKWYDFIVNGIKVDIKGNWLQRRSFEQTSWERATLERNGDTVVYLCFDIDQDADNFIVFEGAAVNTAMRPSLLDNPTKAGTGYVLISSLKDFQL